jgi:xylan 1,4-beta-xylosidase
MAGLACAGTAAAQTPAAPSAESPSGGSFPVEVTVDAGSDEGPVTAPWRFFGADEPNYATMKDGRTTLATLGALDPGRVFFRAHNLLTSGDGTPALKWGSTNAYTEDAAGHPVYDWTIVDRIFDTYLARGIKPYVEIGFMPEALSTRPQPYQHDWRPGSGSLRTGWAYPPKDYAKWE